jgi:hypothetical protein
LRAVVFTDDAILCHKVDQSCGSPVADSQGSLEQRAATSSFANHNIDSSFIKIIASFEGTWLGASLFIVFIDFELYELLNKILDTAHAAMIDDCIDFEALIAPPKVTRNLTRENFVDFLNNKLYDWWIVVLAMKNSSARKTKSPCQYQAIRLSGYQAIRLSGSMAYLAEGVFLLSQCC